MIELLPKIFLYGNRPSFYDTDSATVIELSANMHSKMYEMIDVYNKFRDSVNAQITEFINSTNQNYEVFQTAMRQEFQDFIDVINIKYDAQEQIIRDLITECERRVDAKVLEASEATDALITRIDAAIDTLLASEH